jgi:hypothetical protein
MHPHVTKVVAKARLKEGASEFGKGLTTPEGINVGFLV